MTRPCIEPGCPAPTQRTRCPQHERLRDRARRPPGRYGGSYQANRLRVLAGDPPCYFRGCTSPGTTADHILPLRDGGTHDIENLRSSCLKHNAGRRD